MMGTDQADLPLTGGRDSGRAELRTKVPAGFGSGLIAELETKRMKIKPGATMMGIFGPTPHRLSTRKASAAQSASQSALETAESVLAMSDEDLMERYSSLVADGEGQAIGEPHHTPIEAAQAEGWGTLRQIYRGTNSPGTPVLAACEVDYGLWIVNDDNGPWAVQIWGQA